MRRYDRQADRQPLHLLYQFTPQESKGILKGSLCTEGGSGSPFNKNPKTIVLEVPLAGRDSYSD